MFCAFLIHFDGILNIGQLRPLYRLYLPAITLTTWRRILIVFDTAIVKF